MSRRSGRDDRYDRQLRLWGDHGQSAIEEAKVCLIRAGATGAEILKNLVLPGLGSFTIIDDAIVCEDDLGCNFYLTESDLHKPRAKAVTECLLELNESVSGNYVIENIVDLIENDPQFFLGFNIIIVTDAREELWVRLSRIVQQSAIPLVICLTLGMIGYLRLSTREHVIVESHPDATLPDLRLDKPLAGLVKMVDELALEDMSPEQLAHTPWLLVVHVYVQQFVKKHGHFPHTYKEKIEVRKSITAASVDLTKRLRERGQILESSFLLDNFQEALRAVNTAVCPTEISPEVRELLEDERCSNTTVVSSCLNGSNSVIPLAPTTHGAPLTRQLSTTQSRILTGQTFWHLVCAMRDFIHHEGEGQLPVRGTLPDMTSDSQRYVKLLAIYRERFEWGVERILSRLTQFPDITIHDVRLFVKNAAFLRVVRYRSLEQELKLSPARSEDLALIPTHEENDAMLWYLVLRGACSFLSETGRWPGSLVPYTTRLQDKSNGVKTAPSEDSLDGVPAQRLDGDDGRSAKHIIEADLPAFRSHLARVLRAFGISANRVSLDYVNELCRFGGGEPHTVSAFMGGIAAQEVIKLLTHQFTPITKPLVYNAITQRTELVEM